MIITIASGKGGTGKTLTAASIALSIKDSIYIDCDVEEPNGHIFLDPIFSNEEYVFKKIPEIDYSLCSFCGKCSAVCEFNALLLLKDEILLFKELCHSCGACTYFCPNKAINEIDEKIGTVKKGISGKESVKFVEGRLFIGQMAAAPVIKEAKKETTVGELNIIDAPPGTSCSMVETVRDADFCLLVTEPTPFGLNDLQLAVDALRIIGTPFGVLINKWDDNYKGIEIYCSREKIEILMKIPFDENIAHAYSGGKAIVEVMPEYKSKFLELVSSIQDLLKRKNIEAFEEAGSIKR